MKKITVLAPSQSLRSQPSLFWSSSWLVDLLNATQISTKEGRPTLSSESGRNTVKEKKQRKEMREMEAGHTRTTGPSSGLDWRKRTAAGMRLQQFRGLWDVVVLSSSHMWQPCWLRKKDRQLNICRAISQSSFSLEIINSSTCILTWSVLLTWLAVLMLTVVHPQAHLINIDFFLQCNTEKRSLLMKKF